MADLGSPTENPVSLDGSQGEGGGQILRTALTLSLLTGRPFRMVRVRENRATPGLRPQHVKAVEAASLLGDALVRGNEVGSRELEFQPRRLLPRDLELDIGTAGSTGLILQTLQLPLSMRSRTAVRLSLVGGTFNPHAPPYPFLERTWKAYLAAFGLPIALTMPKAGFYPRGGGRLEAWIEPACPRSWSAREQGRLVRLRCLAGVCNLPDDIAHRMLDQAAKRLAHLEPSADLILESTRWQGPGRGAALSLTADYEAAIPATFVGLGERGRPSEVVADDAVDQLLNHLAVPQGAVDLHSADQILLPLAMAEGASDYTVSQVTEHLRTNAATIRQFLDREIVIEEATAPAAPGRVIIA